MNIVAGISILILFALWISSEARCIEYKKKFNEYLILYRTAKELCDDQIKINDDNMKFLNEMQERLDQMDKDSKADWDALKKRLDDLKEDIENEEH